MGKSSKQKQQRRQHVRTYHEVVKAARVQWVGKLVQFDAGQGRGMKQGRVTEVSDEGLVLVECLPGSGRVRGAALTLDMVDQLTLVHE